MGPAIGGAYECYAHIFIKPGINPHQHGSHLLMNHIHYKWTRPTDDRVRTEYGVLRLLNSGRSSSSGSNIVHGLMVLVGANMAHVDIGRVHQPRTVLLHLYNLLQSQSEQRWAKGITFRTIIRLNLSGDGTEQVTNAKSAGKNIERVEVRFVHLLIIPTQFFIFSNMKEGQ